jgi:hypothetical protein
MRWVELTALVVLVTVLAAGPLLAQEPPEQPVEKPTEQPAEEPKEEQAKEPAKPPPPLAVTELEAYDTPNDAGKSILVTWKKWAGETKENAKKVEYVVLAAPKPDGLYYEATLITGDKNLKSEKPAYFGFAEENAHYHWAEVKLSETWPKKPRKGSVKGKDGETYYFKVRVSFGDKQAQAKVPVSAASSENLFDTGKLNNLVLTILFAVVVMSFIQHAKKNPELFIRKISGLDAVDEAIGRATEMGKPIFYITGLQPMSSLPTIASINMLGRVAKIIAEHDTVLKVPCYDPIVMSVAQEVVKDSYTKAGRPDAYNEDNVFYVTSDQFSYVAAVDGMMFREEPATNFFLGYFYAESLLLAEAGTTIGAIQIAGTDALAQLPFFVTTCDYTLIGEELYAASAYLTREPVLLGSLRGQDVGKAFVMAIAVIGTLLALVGVPIVKHLLTPF